MNGLVVPCDSNSTENFYHYKSTELNLNISKCIVAVLGITTNTVTLVVFHRIRWFRRDQMLFFLITTFATLITCFCLLVPSIFFVTAMCLDKDRMWKQFTCVSLMVPGSAALTSLQRFTLLVAVDRVGAQWFSYQWSKFKVIYKWTAVFLFAVWSIGQESFWLAFIEEDRCVVSCFFGYFVYPVTWWHTVVNVSDMVVTIFIFLLFIAVPVATVCRQKSVFKQIKSECFIIQEQNIFLPQRESLARVRLLSFIYVAGFICTTCSGMILSEQYGFANLDPTKSLYMNAAANFLKNIHFVFSPFIFLIDASFRRELCRCCFKKLLKF